MPLLDELKEHAKTAKVYKCAICRMPRELQAEIEAAKEHYSFNAITEVLRKRGHDLVESTVKTHISYKHSARFQ